jgi:hypothetical protein
MFFRETCDDLNSGFHQLLGASAIFRSHHARNV